jgi:hypothetical protein
MRHDLPSGAWIETRDARAVTERLRRPVKHASGRFRNDMGSDEAMAVYDDVLDLATVALISAWSFDAPVVVDSLLDLSGDDIDAVRAIIEPLMPLLLPNFSASSVADDPKDKVPSGG